MTENEAINELQANIDLPFGFTVSDEVSEIAIQALEEIQSYRAIGLTPQMVKDLIASEKKAHKTALENANMLDEYKEIGTIEELKALKNKHIGKDNMVISSSDLMTILNSDSEELKQYKEVGTVEELQALKEKSVEKKVKVKPKYNKGRRIDAYFCPSCDKFICFIGEVHSTTITKTYIYCNICGQKLDWIE